MDCVNRIKVDSTSCQKSCSGLVITTLLESDKKKSLADFPIFEDYDNYKKITTFPSGKSVYISSATEVRDDHNTNLY